METMTLEPLVFLREHQLIGVQLITMWHTAVLFSMLHYPSDSHWLGKWCQRNLPRSSTSRISSKNVNTVTGPAQNSDARKEIVPLSRNQKTVGQQLCEPTQLKQQLRAPNWARVRYQTDWNEMSSNLLGLSSACVAQKVGRSTTT